MPMYQFHRIEMGKVVGTITQEMTDDEAALHEVYGVEGPDRVNPMDPTHQCREGTPVHWVEIAHL